MSFDLLTSSSTYVTPLPSITETKEEHNQDVKQVDQLMNTFYPIQLLQESFSHFPTVSVRPYWLQIILPHLVLNCITEPTKTI